METKFLAIGFRAKVHEMSERPMENGWYIVRLNNSHLAWAFHFEGKWNWEEDLSNPADETRFMSWHTPDVGGALQNKIISQ